MSPLKRIVFGILLLFFISLLLWIGYNIVKKQKRSGLGEAYWEMVSQIRTQTDKQALTELEKFIMKHPRSDYVEDAFYNICKIKFKGCLNGSGNWDEAIKSYSKLLKDYPNSVYTEPTSFFLALSYAKRGDTTSNKLQGKTTNTDSSCLSNDYLVAINRFKKFIQSFPKSDLVDEAYYNLGRLYWALNMYEQAILSYQKIIKQYRNDDLVDEAYYRLSEIYISQKNYTEAKQWLNRIPYSFPRSKIIPYSQSMLGYCEYLQKNTANAIKEYKRALISSVGNPIEKELKDFLFMIEPNNIIKTDSKQTQGSCLWLNEGIVYSSRENKKESLLFMPLKKNELDNMDIFPFNTPAFPCPAGNGFLVGSGDYLWWMNINGQRKKLICPQDDSVLRVIWSPDGQTALYKGKKGSYLLYPAKASEMQSLHVQEETTLSIFNWSPNSRLIACIEKGRKNDMVIFNSDGTERIRIKNFLQKNYSIKNKKLLWSPNSKKIAFCAVRQLSKGIVEEIYIVDIDKGNSKRLAYDSVDEIAWSPDSSLLAYTNYRGTSLLNLQGQRKILSWIRMGNLKWRNVSTICGIGIREQGFVYRIIRLDRTTEKLEIKGKCPLLSDDGLLVAFTDKKGQLWIQYLSGKSYPLKLSALGNALKWLNKGKYLLYESQGNYFISNRNGANKQQFYQGNRIISLARWYGKSFIPADYDNQNIVGVLNERYGSNIIEVSRNNGQILPLTRYGGNNPVLSEDKKCLVYENRDNLWLLTREPNPKCFQLTSNSGNSPKWSKDGVVFIRPKDSLSNWWNWNLRMNIWIREQNGRVAKEYLLDVLTPIDNNSGLFVIKKNSTLQRLIKGEIDSFDISPQGDIVIERKGKISLFKNSRICTIAMGCYPLWSPDGNKIAYKRENSLFVINTSEMKETKLSEIKGGATSARDFAWSADGTKIVYSNNGAIYIKDIKNRKEVQLTRSAN